MRHFLEVTRRTNAQSVLDNLDERSLVIYSPTSLKYLNNINKRPIFVSTHDTGKDIDRIEWLIARYDANLVVGLGGGSAIDIAKYAATVIGCELICIPAMLSTNSFSTNKAALIKGAKKVTLKAKFADQIVFDSNLIAKAGKYNLYGLCDIFSIDTALYDWKLADSAGIEEIDLQIYERSNKLLNDAIRFARNLKSQNKLDIDEIFNLVGESGHITNVYGSGRPESGSEHIFAKELESRTDLHHGISVAIGINLMSQLQGNYSEEIQDAMQKIGVTDDIACIFNLREIVHQALVNLLPRADRYTILNEKLPIVDGRTKTAHTMKAKIGVRG